MPSIEINANAVPHDDQTRIAALEAKLGRLREEYNNLKCAQTKQNTRDMRAQQVIRNLSPLMDLFGALEERLANAQREILDVANGHAETKSLFATAEVLGKLVPRVHRMASELTLDPTETR